MIQDNYDDFLFASMMDSIEELKILKEIIEELKREELYTQSLEYDWDESPHEVYEPFDVEEFIENEKIRIKRRS